MNYALTKDADYLICVLYKAYKERRNCKSSKVDAKFMNDSETIHKTLMPEWSFEDVDETCRELHRAGLLDCKYADDVAYIVNLTDASIIYMENRFKSGLKEVTDFIAKFIP